MTTRSPPGLAALPAGAASLSSCAPRLPTPPRAIGLFVDIGQGAGLAGASGVRPFLPPLLAGALARGDVALDFDDSGWEFLESPGFLLAVFALAVLWYGAERSAPNRWALAAGVLGAVLGALLFAGSLAAGGEEAWPGLLAGAACAALGYGAVGTLFARARRRLEEGAAGALALYAEGAALLIAALAILVPPLGFLALAAFVLLLITARREAGRKYAGLRILR